MTAEASDNNTTYWQCTRCTLHNINTNTSCEACGGLNPEFTYDGASDDEPVQELPPKLEGYRIQGIYYQKQRAHRLQHNGADGANALIALCNLLFLQQKMKWTKDTKRVTFNEIEEFLGDVLPDLVGNNKLKYKHINEIKPNDKLQHVNKLDPISEEPEDCDEIIKKWPKLLENDNDCKQSIEIYNSLGVKLYDLSVEETKENINESDRYEMTVKYLCRLYSEMNENELAVLYRNGFYSTIVRHENILYEFVTNEQYINADPQITWRTMLSINGTEQNTNNKFGQTHITNKTHYYNYENSIDYTNYSQYYKYKLAYVGIIEKELNRKLLLLTDDNVDELEHCLFNFSYIAGIKYGKMSYLMYLFNIENKILFDGYIRMLEININIILPNDVRNLCLKYFANDYIINDIILYFEHQHISVCYPAVLTIHNIIILDHNKQYKTIKTLINKYDVLNKFHNLICIDSGPNIKETVYNTILYIVNTNIFQDNIINDGLIITLIERLNDTTNYSSEYKQCLRILNQITTNSDHECIDYLVENNLIQPLCQLLKSDQEDDVWNTLDILFKMIQITNNKKQIIQYIHKYNGLLILRDLALSGIQHIAKKCQTFIDATIQDLDDIDIQSIEMVLFKMGLDKKYSTQFEEFGIDYSLLNNVEAPIVECIIQNKNDQKQFMLWLNKHQKSKANQSIM